LTARTDRRACFRVGDPVAVELAMDRVHLFDSATGDNLTLDAGQ
jgi:hypothetical protein